MVAHGLTRSRISRWAATGQLEPVAPGVYRLPGSQPTWRTDLLAAVLSSSQPALGSHRAAAAVHGLRGFAPGTIDICSERWFRHRLASTGFEQLLVSILDNAGLPMPVAQHKVVDGSFTAYLDFAYPEHRVAIEADSEEYHLDLPTFHHDRSRQNHLTMLGWTMLRYTGVHLHTQQHLVANQIAMAIGLRGPR